MSEHRFNLLPPLALALLLPLSGTAAPKDLREIWQPPPHPSMPPRVQVLSGLDAPASEAPAEAPNIVLVTIDTWRADRLGLYGSPRGTSPWLETLAEDAIVFDRAIAPSSWTWPTMASLASGLNPRGHGAVKPDSPLCSEADTIAEVFHNAGWRTGFVGSNTYFEPEDSGYRQGFEFYFATGSEDAARVLEYTGYFLEGARNLPFFLHIHLFDPHCPYDPAPNALETVREVPFGPPGVEPGTELQRFDARQALMHTCHVVPPIDSGTSPDTPYSELEVSDDILEYLDHYDGELLETDRALRMVQAVLTSAAGAWDDSWVVITGDHGEEFGEHGRIGHGENLFAETSWVPLIIRPPGGAGELAGRVEQPVSLVDIPYTLVQAAGLGVPGSWQGRDLGPAMRGEAMPAAPVLAETIYRNDSWASLLYDGDHRMTIGGIRPPIAQLFSNDEPMDIRNLFSEETDLGLRVRAAQMAGKMRSELGEQKRTAVCQTTALDADPTHWEALKTLGYTVESSPGGSSHGHAPRAPVYE